MAERYAEAIPFYQKAIAAGQRVPDSTVLMAQALIIEGSYDEGLRISESLGVSELPEPTLMTLASSRASALDQLNRVPDAIAEIESVLPRVSTPARRAFLLGYLGNLYNQNREFLKARDILREAQSLNSGDETVRASLHMVERNLARQQLAGGGMRVRLRDLNLRVGEGITIPDWFSSELEFESTAPVKAGVIAGFAEMRGKQYGIVHVWRSAEPPLSEKHCGEVYFCNQGTDDAPRVIPVVLSGVFSELPQSDRMAFVHRLAAALGLI
jgi:tetratricopeptide (TPR) repeat protein